MQLVIHLLEKAELVEPISYSWTYPIERYISFCSYSLNYVCFQIVYSIPGCIYTCRVLITLKKLC